MLVYGWKGIWAIWAVSIPIYGGVLSPTCSQLMALAETPLLSTSPARRRIVTQYSSDRIREILGTGLMTQVRNGVRYLASVDLRSEEKAHLWQRMVGIIENDSPGFESDVRLGRDGSYLFQGQGPNTQVLVVSPKCRVYRGSMDPIPEGFLWDADYSVLSPVVIR